jgi:hypothetical protein
LDEDALKASLLSLFTAMKLAPMTEAEYAEMLAKIINNHIKTAQVDSGTLS